MTELPGSKKPSPLMTTIERSDRSRTWTSPCSTSPFRNVARRGVAVGAVAAQHLREAHAEALELRLAVVEDAVAALEAERQRHVHQLEQVAVALHVFRQLRHQLEHLLAAPRLVVEQDQQALRRPD